MESNAPSTEESDSTVVILSADSAAPGIPVTGVTTNNSSGTVNLLSRGSQTILTLRGIISDERSSASQQRCRQSVIISPLPRLASEDDEFHCPLASDDSSSNRRVSHSTHESENADDGCPSSRPALSSGSSKSLKVLSQVKSFESESTSESENFSASASTKNHGQVQEVASFIIQVVNARATVSGENDDRNSPPPILFFDDFNLWSRQRSINGNRLKLFTCCTVGVNTEVDYRNPPQYSQINVTRQIRRTQLPVWLDESFVKNQSSFITRTPPPSYAQAQGVHVPYSLETLISFANSDGRILTPRSTPAICPRCATLVITVVRVKIALSTHVTALGLFLMMCWPCCLFPYFTDSCKTVHHYCPFCRTYLGTYIP